MTLNIAKACDYLPNYLRRDKVARLLLWISPKSKIQPVRFNGGARLYADISDPFPRTYFLTRSYDAEFFSVAAPFLSNGGNFFDIGANFGFCSYGLMALLPGKVQYHLFEAAPDMIKCLKRSAAEHRETIFINHCAVTNEPGFARFHIQKNHLGSSRLSPTGECTVDAITLDDYFQKNGIQDVPFMKMDIEGAEPKAILGGAKNFSKGTVKALFFEVSQENLALFGWKAENYLNLLREMGFEIFHVRERDFQRGAVDPKDSFILPVGNSSLRMAPAKSFPANFDTDFLALHRTSEYLNRS